MTIWQFMGENPILTLFLVYVIGGTVVYTTRAITGYHPSLEDDDDY